VKSFKWLALQEDMDRANEFSTQFVKEQEQLAKQALLDKLQGEYEANNKIKVGVEKILQMDTTAPDVKKVLVDEILNEAKIKAQNKVEEKIETDGQKAKETLGNIQNQLKEQAKEKLKNTLQFPITSKTTIE